MSTENIIDIEDLSVIFGPDQQHPTVAVDKANLSIKKGEALGIVGESGCGKSSLALALMGLINKQHAKIEGHANFDSKNLLALSNKQFQKIRGKQIAMIFQDPMTSLNPFIKIGYQITEQIRQHNSISKDDANKEAIDLLKAVGIPNAEDRFHRFPHEFSGGMRQRVMIACAMSCSPDLIIADEPTTALDVTIQSQVLQLMKDQLKKRQMSLLLITHDLGVVANTCDRVIIMYAGQIVESGSIEEIFYHSKHPYTHALLQSVPNLSDDIDKKLISIEGQPPVIQGHWQGCRFYDRCPYAQSGCKEKSPELIQISDTHFHRCSHLPTEYTTPESQTKQKIPEDQETILEIKNLKVTFQLPAKSMFKRPALLHAVNDVTINLKKGEVYGLVGESGCGKSTLIRGILQLVKPSAGSVIYKGIDLTRATESQIKESRRDMQLIFQDPFSSLNARMRVFDIIAEPINNFLHLNKSETKEKVLTLMDEVGLNRDWIKRYPHQFSGGQRQRIGIARALALKPKILFCDEPISALDVSIQAQIINLLQELRAKHQLTLVFISHDLSVIRQISNRIGIMYLGKIVESTDAATIYQDAKHPYTQSLLKAIPIPDPKIEKAKESSKISGELPSPEEERPGCDFAPRCPLATEKCLNNKPELEAVEENHYVSCFYPKGSKE
ncbi:MAG: glutathione ABC transporter ATP-binding protein [Planctomycetota bacterium]|nr:MAG: glutathione ABC transporter ATP-binding protein [Planctomycetota bacterium]